VLINYRGIGIELKTPQLYNSYAFKDVQEPMHYVFEKFCKPTGRQAFAVGTSMGANILANLLGEEGDESILTAACVV